MDALEALKNGSKEEDMLARAIFHASRFHYGQKDQGGNPYILHPIRVMMQFTDETLQIIAVLHDVLEDTRCTVGSLRCLGFSEDIIDALIALTRNKGESYMDFIRRCKLNDFAREIKIKDIRDNMNLDRIPNPTDEDRARIPKYEKALKILEAA